MTNSTRLSRPLLDDRIDVIGDVHGEIDSLTSLLHGLGVDVERARVDRPIVFVGDLIDRGPDSVAVLEIVEHLVRSGVAQVVLGNHEFNLLRGDEKEGNGWFFSSRMRPDGWHDGSVHVPFPSRNATLSERQRIRAFLLEQPLALTSESLRVVHAAWSEGALAALSAAEGVGDVLRGDEGPESDRLSSSVPHAPTLAEILDPTHRPVYHPAFAHALARSQNADPAKVLTSGPERPLANPDALEYLGGKWRFVERDPWWDRDDDPRPVVFGHYWRRRAAGGTPFKASMFTRVAPDAWFGRRGQAFCVDYSVGYRFRARHHGTDSRRDYALAALRMPERTLRFDDGSKWCATQGFGTA
jgi:hypothetical protein